MKKGILVIIYLSLLISCDSNNFSSDSDSLLETYQFGGQTLSNLELLDLAEQIRKNPDIREMERPLHELSDKIPGFAGYYFNPSGKPVVMVKGSQGRAAARRELNSHLQNNNNGRFYDSDIEIKEALYSFEELIVFRDLISNLVLGNKDFEFINFVDLDESISKIVLGLKFDTPKTNVAYLEKYLRSILSIPIKAIKYEASNDIIPDIGHNNYSLLVNSSVTLNHYYRPFVGGLGIKRNNNSSNSGTCTAGFIAILNGENVFVTNSHCTPTTFGFDDIYSGSFFYQTFGLVAPSNRIGLEYLDPSTETCWLHKCRYSDAVAIKIDDNVSFDIGKIIRTEYSASSGNGSLIISASSPTLSIAKSNEYIAQGMSVNKIGRNTGWTTGNITKTCVDHARTDVTLNTKLKCQYRASYNAADGDSGSPIFKIVYDADGWEHASLLGIHWGRKTENLGTGPERAVFSPMSGIRHDLGNLYPNDPNAPNIPPNTGGGGGGIGPTPCSENPLNCNEL